MVGGVGPGKAQMYSGPHPLWRLASMDLSSPRCGPWPAGPPPSNAARTDANRPVPFPKELEDTMLFVHVLGPGRDPEAFVMIPPTPAWTLVFVGATTQRAASSLKRRR
jgi:hypothetical protein